MKKDIRCVDDCGFLLAAAKSPCYWIPEKPHGSANFPIKFQSKLPVNHKKQNHRKSASLSYGAQRTSCVTKNDYVFFYSLLGFAIEGFL